MTENDVDALQSIYTAAGDIARYVLLACISRRLSADRRRDIVSRAEYIITQLGRIK